MPNRYEAIKNIHEKLDNEILELIKEVIEKSRMDAEKQKLGPIQTFIHIMTNVNHEMNIIKDACKMDHFEPFSEELETKIYELTNPYYEKMEDSLIKYIGKNQDVETLGELLEHNDQLDSLVDELRETGICPEDIVLKKSI